MRDAKWRRYLRFWRHDVAADVDDELRFHLGERVEALVAAGLTRDAARRRAEEEFGNVHAVRRGLQEIDERVMATRRRANRLERWWQDVAYSARALRRTPGVSLTVIVTLALGIGLNATLFSLLDRIFLRPPAGVVRPDEVRRLYWSGRGPGGTVALGYFAIPLVDDIRDAASSIAGVTTYRLDRAHFGDDPDEVHTIVEYTGANYFTLLGVRPAYGRFFAREEERVDVPAPVAVVSDSWWRRRMGGSPADAIGQTIRVEKQRYTVIGVAPAGFTGPDLDAVDIWVPLGMFSDWVAGPGQPPWYKSPNALAFQVLARPRAGVVRARLDAAATLGARRALASGALLRPTTISDGPILAARGPEERDNQANAIAIRLGGVALIVLLIACANAANLLIVRAVARGREFAIRAALGIDRRGIARLVLLESVLLSIVAGIAALLVTAWSGAALRSMLFSNVSWPVTSFDWRVAGFTVGIALITGVAAGLAPVAQARRTDVSEMLKTGSYAGGRPRRRLRALLVIAQSALSLVLLVGAALFVRSLRAVHAIDLGYDVQQLVFVSADFDSRDYQANYRRAAAAFPALASRLALVPGVEKVALTSDLPMYGLSITHVYDAAGDSLPRASDGLPTVTGVSPAYFAATGIRLRQGRLLEAADVADSGARVAVVNETMARQTWPHGSPLGQCVRLGKRTAPCVTVVGEVEDVKRLQLIEAPARVLYIPAPRGGDYMAATAIVRVPPSRAAGVEAAARRELPALMPGAKAHVLKMADVLAPQYRPWQLGAMLFSIFGLLALLIAAVGIFSVVSHDVGQRRRELGVRIALGASVSDVVRLVLGGGVRVVAVGVVVGLAVAAAASRLIASILYGVTPRDPAVLGGVALVLLAVALLASALPAWRASRADPMEALRSD